jgi:hypothetical protein
MRAIFLTLAVLCLGATPAAATATLDCSFSDENLAFEADATVGHGFGESFVRFRGKLEIRAKNAPADLGDLRTLDLDLEHLTQRWFYGNDLKLRLFRGRSGEGPHASVELVIEAKRASNDNNEYRGTYVLNMSHVVGGEEKTLTLRGRAECAGD